MISAWMSVGKRNEERIIHKETSRKKSEERGSKRSMEGRRTKKAESFGISLATH